MQDPLFLILVSDPQDQQGGSIRIFTFCPSTMPFDLILGPDSPSMNEPCRGTVGEQKTKYSWFIYLSGSCFSSFLFLTLLRIRICILSIELCSNWSGVCIELYSIMHTNISLNHGLVLNGRDSIQIKLFYILLNSIFDSVKFVIKSELFYDFNSLLK